MRILLAALLLAASAMLASAQNAADVVRIELLPGWREADGTHVAGLKIALEPGWKTYWRAPGEAGIPPVFDWSGSQNLASARPHFPVPRVFHVNGIQTVGYRESVVLPLVLRARDPGAPIALRARIDLGVCETICVPFQARVEATLPAGAGKGVEAIRAALGSAPLSAGAAGVLAVRCSIEPIRDGLRLTATLDMPALGSDEAAVIEAGDPGIWVSDVATRRRGGSLTATADLVPPQGAPFALDRSSLRFTVLADGRAVEVRGCGAG